MMGLMDDNQNFGCPCAFAKPADLEFLREKVLPLAEQQAVTSLERQRAPEKAIYLHIYSRMSVLSSQQRKPITRMFCAQGFPA